MSIPDHYRSEIQRYLDDCTRCGLCTRGCPILAHTDVSAVSSQKIQARVFEGMTTGVFDTQARTKAFACMECFKCTQGMCPEGLNPMLVNEVIKGACIAEGSASGCIGDVRAPDSAHRVLARLQVSESDHERITAVSAKGRARYVFFPGCNVYFQPQKILSALDIMDAVGDEYAFIPGLDHCCGDGFFFEGRIEEGADRAEALIAAIAAYRPESVVLWCPTCQCRFNQTISPAVDVPFKVLSFPQYLAANMHKLPLSAAAAGTVTLHEACKSAYTGVDRDGARQVLRQLPGVVLREMDCHGPDAACCGSGAVCWYPQSSGQMRTERLREAARTGADRLVTVCHYCSQTFAAEEHRYDFDIVSYIDLVAAALGLAREDKFKQYTRWGDVEKILKDAEAQIAASPFSREHIADVIRGVFSGQPSDR